MSKEIYISSTPHETRLAIVENDDLTEIYYERENEYTLAGSIYNGKVTRVLPGMQSSFVDVGLERDAFLYITDFMEEAGDSAEFDSGDGASGSRRGSNRDDRGANRDDRSANRDDRGGSREDRSSRDEAAAPRNEANGGSVERLAAPATEPRTDRGDRSDRGDREGGRRRRGGNRDSRSGGRDGRTEGREGQPDNLEDRSGNRDRSVEARIPSPPPTEASFDAAPAVHSGYVEPGAESTASELGEGAPGADGSRRWRGRRGRRRGRSSVQRDESQALQQPGMTQDAPPISNPDEVLGRGYQVDSANAEEVEEDFDREYEDSFDLDASAAAPAPSVSTPIAAAPQEPAVSSRVDDRPRRNRADRTDRGDRDQPRRDRGNRDGRAPRAPRGFAPSRAHYGVDAANEPGSQSEEIAGGPTAEPLILPGESLSKYRKGDDAQASSSTTQASTPANSAPVEFKLAAAWDGGNVLPGETIRPRSNADFPGGAPDRSGPDRSSLDRFSEGHGGGSRGGGRDDRRGREVRSARSDRADRPDRSNRSDRSDQNDRSDRSRSSVQTSPLPVASFRNESAPSSEPRETNRSATVPELSINASAAQGSAQVDIQDTERAAYPTSSSVSRTTHASEQTPFAAGSTEPEHGAEHLPVMSAATGEFDIDISGTGEYEPSEASASVRFDPASRREFRQSAPVVEPSNTSLPDATPPYAIERSFISPESFPADTDDTSPATEQGFRGSEAQRLADGDADPAADLRAARPAPAENIASSTQEIHSIAHHIILESGVPIAPIHTETFNQAPPATEPQPAITAEPASEFQPVGETASKAHHPFADIHESALAELTPLDELTSGLETTSGHEFTFIQNTGEMLSAAPPPPVGEIAEPTSPLHHESAILDTAPASESSLQSSPGTLDTSLGEDDDLLEEGEDFKATTLHASSIEEMDYEEEEILEGAADLGTMIREMSIDQITRTGQDSEEDEDVLEEEDAVDDHLNGSYEEPDEEDDAEQPHRFDESSSSPANDDLEGVPANDRGYAAATSTGVDSANNGQDASRDSDRQSGRRDGGGRRDGRRDGRGRDRDRGGDRARSTGGSGDRSTSRPGRRDGRHSAQTTNLPAISDLLKPGQEVLVQIAKEPIAKKGARITSHIALPGRFLVFMPTVNHTGVSRKIESDGERRRLKEILLSEKGEASGGFIVRTAASGASEEELRSDLRFLLNLWADIKQRSESSKSPALIYHDLNLVERILRDQVTDTFSAIWVDTETEYERVLRFLQRFQPSLIRRVKLYTKEAPLFEQFGITEEINKALRSKVWLKSGGSIVINQTEALVAIDINTGKYVGKTARLEDTIVKTNLDAIPEIVRQIRLRDLGGIIIIDFIDMDERKNRAKVMSALEDELKKDRAPSKVLQFNDFGLVAITRKRVKQSLERTLSSTCNVCQGTGMTKSPVTVCNDIYIEMRKMQKHLDRGDVMLRVNPEVVKQLKATGTKWLQEMEEMVGKTILVKSDPSLHPEQFDIH